MRSVLALIAAVKPPAFPGTVDRRMAAKGLEYFQNVPIEVNGVSETCSSCHDSGRLVNVGTDPELSKAFFEFGKMFVGLRGWWEPYTYKEIVNPATVDARTGKAAAIGSYVAPPLTAHWTRNLVLHNASLPSQWFWNGWIASDARKIKVSLSDVFQPFPEDPAHGAPSFVLRSLDVDADPYSFIRFDRTGSLPDGHTFVRTRERGGKLTNEQQDAILEYLKLRCELAPQNLIEPAYGVLDENGNCQ